MDQVCSCDLPFNRSEEEARLIRTGSNSSEFRNAIISMVLIIPEIIDLEIILEFLGRGFLNSVCSVWKKLKVHNFRCLVFEIYELCV